MTTKQKLRCISSKENKNSNWNNSYFNCQRPNRHKGRHKGYEGEPTWAETSEDRAKSQRKHLRGLGLDMKFGLRGITLNWVEINTLTTAVEQTIKKCPRGQFVSEFLSRVGRRLIKRRNLNNAAIAKAETK